MTLRALIILELESFSNGHQLPIIVIGVLVICVLLINPLLRKIHRGLPFKAAEMALVVTLASCACGIPGRALMEQFAQAIIMPYHWQRINPGWKDRDMLQYYPKDSLVKMDEQDEVLNRFLTGSDKPATPPENSVAWLKLKISQVPWANWPMGELASAAQDMVPADLPDRRRHGCHGIGRPQAMGRS